jgi:SAM-dependent methyltransferase
MQSNGERRRAELGKFLKARRARLSPGDFGMPPGSRRRTPGLRREEVALLAGVGVTWYTWLEQGRQINASTQVLDAVARTLRLDRAEREHLYRLAEATPLRTECARLVVPDTIREIVHSLEPLPASLINSRFDFLMSNSASEELFWEWHTMPCIHKNTLWCCVTEPSARAKFAEYDSQVRYMVARLRAAYARHIGDPEWEEDIRRLASMSREFAELWARHEVAEVEPRTLTYLHPRAGTLSLAVSELNLPDLSEARIVVYTPRDDETRARMPLTRMTPTQMTPTQMTATRRSASTAVVRLAAIGCGGRAELMSASGTASKYEPRVPDGVDVSRPSIARIYDYLLYGKDNFAVDRAAAEKLMESRLDPRRLSLANRAFLFRAVRFLAQQGIAQYLDLGSGLPTSPSVHEVARDTIPGARVVYVDHDPIVVAHNDALLATRDGVITIRGDVRDPDTVLAHSSLNACLDFSQPVAVLLLSVLHFISHEEDAPRVIAKIRERLAPGSYLAISVGTSDGADPEMLAEATQTYAGARMPFTLRSRAQILDLFDGFDLVEPGLVSLPEWRPAFNTDRTPLKGPTLGAVAQLRK